MRNCLRSSRAPTFELWRIFRWGKMGKSFLLGTILPEQIAHGAAETQKKKEKSYRLLLILMELPFYLNIIFHLSFFCAALYPLVEINVFWYGELRVGRVRGSVRERGGAREVCTAAESSAELSWIERFGIENRFGDSRINRGVYVVRLLEVCKEDD